MSAHIICDLGFGDAGKGSWTDSMAHKLQSNLVVRYNGGAQAAHTVYLPDGRKHTFNQFGSASFIPDVPTLLSRFMLINPMRLVHEAHDLQLLGVENPYGRIFIDQRALVTTPYQMAANRLREYCRAERHGSCGLGVGETMQDWLDFPDHVLVAADFHQPELLRQKLTWHRQLKVEQLADQLTRLTGVDLPSSIQNAVALLTQDSEAADIDDFLLEIAGSLQILSAEAACQLMNSSHHPIFEGAQGVLLDENFGFHPNTTWSTTTPQNALTLLEEAGFTGEVTRYGILRTYATRHGAGPFPTSDSDLQRQLAEPDNPTNDWQGEFRVGHLDLNLLRYALKVAPVDALLISGLDQTAPLCKVATSYTLEGKPYELQAGEVGDLAHQEQLGEELRRVIPQYTDIPNEAGDYAEWQAAVLRKPLVGVSYGKTYKQKCCYF
jgi:adenylosuccinate synthase